MPIGVVSNAAGQIESVLRRFGVCQVGEGDGVPVVIIIDSTIVGVAKPDPAIFSFALDVLDAKPEHVAYVGDSYANDVVGARAAGMRPFLLDPYDDHAGADYERIKAVAEPRALSFEQATSDHAERQDLVGTLEDRQHAGVDEQTAHRVLLGVAVAPVDLHRLTGDPLGRSADVCLDHRRFERAVALRHRAGDRRTRTGAPLG